MDVTAIFCEVDDFCQQFAQVWSQQPQLPSMPGEKRCGSRLHLSEVMTIVIAFHGSGARTFKDFYTLTVLPHWRNAFPNLVSYTRFVELMPWGLMLLCCFAVTRRGKVTGLAFIDSTPLEVCLPARAHAHKVFKDLVGWGKSSTGWKFGFKLHLIINERGELLAFKLTPANTDDRQPVPEMTQDLFGQLFGDRGYISQQLFEQLYDRGLQLVTKRKKNMKQKLVKLIDKILLRKRALIETVNDQLKNQCQIEHSRHRSIWNFLVNLVAGLIAYTYQPKLPSLDLKSKGLPALPEAIF
ncbi:IS982 family transposase [Alkalinema sp. FACHB-956]|uniref:IS982 family transposase n=1 Tax=Alkalinema sp. FACHB-956 TaxID=2692768 RepID=UPI0016824CC8|nr:IS982 family transposase [Alkalinema sp. FACHB-956]MBD2328610.1 IS982 family transposase [Alkalinema sp. FACHB-956]